MLKRLARIKYISEIIGNLGKYTGNTTYLDKLSVLADKLEFKISLAARKTNISGKKELTDMIGILSKYVAHDNTEYFIHYGSVDKVGINPQSTFATPLGIYFYPLTPTVYRNVINNTSPFTGKNPFSHIFLLKNNNPEKTLVLQNYSVNEELRKIRPYINNDETLGQIIKFSKENAKSEISAFWLITRYCAYLMNNKWESDPKCHLKASALQWSKFFKDILGYEVIIDFGEGIIHSSEAYQGFAVAKNNLEIESKWDLSNKTWKESTVDEDAVDHEYLTNETLLTVRYSDIDKLIENDKLSPYQKVKYLCNGRLNEAEINKVIKNETNILDSDDKLDILYVYDLSETNINEVIKTNTIISGHKLRTLARYELSEAQITEVIKTGTMYSANKSEILFIYELSDAQITEVIKTNTIDSGDKLDILSKHKLNENNINEVIKTNTINSAYKIDILSRYELSETAVTEVIKTNTINSGHKLKILSRYELSEAQIIEIIKTSTIISADKLEILSDNELSETQINEVIKTSVICLADKFKILYNYDLSEAQERKLSSLKS